MCIRDSHCEPAAAGRFWAVYGLPTPQERSTYTDPPDFAALAGEYADVLGPASRPAPRPRPGV